MNKKIVSIILIIIITISVINYIKAIRKSTPLDINNANGQELSKTTKIPALHAITSVKPLENKKQVSKEKKLNLLKGFIKEACKMSEDSFKNLKKNELKNEEFLAKNLHFEKNGDIYRIRIFIEDSENGGFEKLVYYKEDEDEFPRVIKIPKEDQVNPGPEVIKKYLAGGKVIHNEQDTRYYLKNGSEIVTTIINDDFFRVHYYPADHSEPCIWEKEGY